MVVNTGELDPPATIAVKLSSTTNRNNYGELLLLRHFHVQLWL